MEAVAQSPEQLQSPEAFIQKFKEQQQFFNYDLTQKVDDHLQSVVCNRVELPDRIVALVEHRAQAQMLNAINASVCPERSSNHDSLLAANHQLAQALVDQSELRTAECELQIESDIEIDHMKVQLQKEQHQQHTVEHQLTQLQPLLNYWL